MSVRPEGPPLWPGRDASVRAALLASFDGGGWGKYHGVALPALRNRLQSLLGVEHVIPCASGTAAVELALRGVGVGPGDEVILSAYDFKANFLNVIVVGAKPVLVDIQPVTGQLDVAGISAALSPRTRAVIASHLHCGAVDVPALRQGLAGAEVAIIEDACQTPLAPLFGKRAGAGGDVGVLSFGGSKLLSAGRGGAVLTDRAGVAARIRRWTERGNDAYPLSELQAAVLLPQLELLDERRQQRRQAAVGLRAELFGAPGVAPWLPPTEAAPDVYKFAWRHDAEALGGLSRETFAAALRAEGFSVHPGFPGLHCIHARSRFRAVGELPHATAANENTLVLHHPILLEDEPAWRAFARAVHKTVAWADAIRAAVPTTSAKASWLGEGEA